MGIGFLALIKLSRPKVLDAAVINALIDKILVFGDNEDGRRAGKQKSRLL